MNTFFLKFLQAFYNILYILVNSKACKSQFYFTFWLCDALAQQFSTVEYFLSMKFGDQISLLFVPARTTSSLFQTDAGVDSVPVSCLVLRLDKNGDTGTKAESYTTSVFSGISPEIQCPLVLHKHFH
jgi:hypothetical protein